MPDYLNDVDLLLVGAGPMAAAYVPVLKELGVSFAVVGRGKESAASFEEKTGIAPILGGIENYWASCKTIPKRAIVAVQVNDHRDCTINLLEHGVKEILLEKSAGITVEDTRAIAQAAQKANAKVVVAYNRRFYSSVLAAEKMIAEDGGISSFSFEFTELYFNPDHWVTEIPGWLIGNSTHVLDLAFFLGGEPELLFSLQRNTCDSPKKYVSFSGAGKTHDGALFSYHADWMAPGRWAAEFMTPKRRFIFRPMEKLQIQKIGSFQIEEYPLDDELDRKFKPGLYLQVECFLKEIDHPRLLSIADQARHMELYYKIMNGYQGKC